MGAAIATLANTSLFSFRELEFLIEAEDPEVYEELRFQHAVNDGWNMVRHRDDVLHTWLTLMPKQQRKKHSQPAGGYRLSPKLCCTSVHDDECSLSGHACCSCLCGQTPLCQPERVTQSYSSSLQVRCTAQASKSCLSIKRVGTGGCARCTGCCKQRTTSDASSWQPRACRLG